MASPQNETVGIIAQGMVDVALQHGFLVMILAVIGLFAILNAVFKVSERAFSLIALTIIIIPIMIIEAVIGRKDFGILHELKGIYGYAKTHPKESFAFIIYAVIVVGGLIAILAVNLASSGGIP